MSDADVGKVQLNELNLITPERIQQNLVTFFEMASLYGKWSNPNKYLFLIARLD